MGLSRRIRGFLREKRCEYVTAKHVKYDNLFNYDIPSCLVYQPDESKVANEVIYCFWTGDNEMSENRRAAFEELILISECEVKLVTPKNLSDYILDEYPLHPAYQYLSCVHKADYLRCYFMYHHGGGYSDIKGATHSWKPLFDKLNGDHTKFALGCPETYSWYIAYSHDFIEGYEFSNLNTEMRKHFPYLIGNTAYIFKPYSPFSKIWITELHRRLDVVYENLKENPGNVWGDNAGYPIPWNSILGQIFHPLSLICYKQIIRDKRIACNLSNYR